jgi:S-formylglutathione hydrolase FrmB
VALIHCEFKSEALEYQAEMRVILPEPEGKSFKELQSGPAERYPVLYLLHGYPGNSSEWQRFSNLERHLEFYPLVVVMPSVPRSFYTDIGQHRLYWTFISEELPGVARSFFPISDLREDTFVAGLSMGGYGALKLALSFPERFAAAASISANVNLAKAPEDPVWQEEFRYQFGTTDSQEGSQNDLFHLLKQTAQSGKPLPRLYTCCGTDDPMNQENRAFANLAVSLCVDITYVETPGIHDWSYFDLMTPRMLAWLPVKKPKDFTCNK